MLTTNGFVDGLAIEALKTEQLGTEAEKCVVHVSLPAAKGIVGGGISVRGKVIHAPPPCISTSVRLSNDDI